MKTGTSLYLDLVRFSAALVVFVGHLEQHAQGHFGPFWTFHLVYFAQTAVFVFFALSGYVIAHVLATRESTPLEFAASRFGRLYSVVIPALILTAACNYFIAYTGPNELAYLAPGKVRTVLSYAGAALFINRFWAWPHLVVYFEPPRAGVFWSLSFEASYYVGMALFVFTRGRNRILSLVLLAIATGPSVILMAPTWLVGFAAYHLSQRTRLRTGLAVGVWLASIVLLAPCIAVEERLTTHLSFLLLPVRTLGMLVAAYLVAMCFAANMIAFNAFSESAERFLRPVSGLIRWLGSLTFTLYLFQYQLLTVFVFYSYLVPPAFRLAWLIVGTLLIVATVGRYCERSKGAYKRCFLSLWKRAATRTL